MTKIKHKLKKWQLTLIIIFSIVLLLLLTTWLFYNSKLNKLNFDKSKGKQSIDTSTKIPIDNSEIDISKLPQGDNSTPIVPPEGDVFKNKDVYNILLLGTDERTEKFSTNARADSMMILSINKAKNTVKLVSLERGVGVPIAGRNDDLLTHTFRYGGANLTLKTVRDCFKVDVDRYVRVNFNTFAKIFDVIGGVDIKLTELEAKALNNEVYTNAITNHRVSPGLNHLDGYDALQYSRLRFIDSDWQRIQRQRTTIQVAVNKTKGMNVLELNNFVDQVLPLVQTNLTKGEITSLLFEAPAFLGVQIKQMTVPAKDTYWGKVGVDGRKMIGIDFEKNSKLLKELFNQ